MFRARSVKAVIFAFGMVISNDANANNQPPITADSTPIYTSTNFALVSKILNNVVAPINVLSVAIEEADTIEEEPVTPVGLVPSEPANTYSTLFAD